MPKFTFKTPEIEESLVLPVAIELWYNQNITHRESFTNQLEVKKWAVDVKEFTQIDGSKLYNFDIITETENTETIEEFMINYFRINFLKEKILPAIVEVQTSEKRKEKEAKEKELNEIKKQIEENIILNS